MAANMMVSRTILLCVWMWCRRVFFKVEQPGGSRIEGHNRISAGIFAALYRKLVFWMGAYGGDSAKSTMLLSNVPWLDNMKKKMTADDKRRFAKRTPTYWSTKCPLTGHKKALLGVLSV